MKQTYFERLILLLLMTLPLLTAVQADADVPTVNYDGWTLSWSSGGLTLTRNETTLLRNFRIVAKNAAGTQLDAKEYPEVDLVSEALADELGQGMKYTYTFGGVSGQERLKHIFCFYEGRQFLTVEARLVAETGQTSTNYIAPIYTTANSQAVFLPQGGDYRMLDMPFDNDSWAGYAAQSFSIGQSVTSSEATCFYDVLSRRGLCIGSIAHDTWKTGITAAIVSSGKVRSLQVFSGYTAEETRDQALDSSGSATGELLPHGTVSGTEVASARIFVGYYADWRDGMEALGEATAALHPKLPWTGSCMFGWQSWGGMAEKVNYLGAVDVSDFYADELMPAGFTDADGSCYIVLDSYWSNLSDAELASFVARCKEHGQHPGIYTTPFSYWGSASASLTQVAEGTSYTYGEMILRGGGTMRKISAYALDPTHPGTLEWNRQRLQKFRDLGFEYVKLDFLNNGTQEADSYYAEGITTGMQAYNYGMERILQMADGMFVDLSIAPVFPAVGHARRISCDAWGERRFSQYVLNSLELGWWLDRVYVFNDPDHLVLQRSEDEAAARMRYSCGAMTGSVLLGDNYSLQGSYVGKQSYRDRALAVATNAEINQVARIGRSFRPVEGSQSAANFSLWQYSYDVGNEFYLDTDQALYYVCFNFSTDKALTADVAFSRLGIDAAQVESIVELWTGKETTVGDEGFTAEVPAGDVGFYKLSKHTSGLGEPTTADTRARITPSGDSLLLTTNEPMTSITVFRADGSVCFRQSVAGRQFVLPKLPGCQGVCLAQVVYASGDTETLKFVQK